MTTPDALLLRRAAESAAGRQQYPAPALYIVATPIGNLADMSLRAVHVLGLVDAIACEDTRTSAVLLRHFGIEGKALIPLHEHNEREAAAGVVERLSRRERVALVSDAGTPAVSDPGAALVAAVCGSGHRVVPIPGASSVVAALSAAGDASGGGFRFVGFVEARGTSREAALRELARDPATQVLFEAPHRIAALLDALAQHCGERPLTIGRELTKQFESIQTLACRDAPAWLAADAHRSRGEFVLVLHHRSGSTASDDDALTHDSMLRVLLAQLPLKQAVAIAVELSGAPRNALYARALALKNGAGD